MSRKTFLPFSPPLIGEEEIQEVIDTLRSDWITTGPKVKRFEGAFAGAVGAPAGLAISSCTAALQVALSVLGIGPGDSVLTTPMTFCSTVHVIEHVGARPLLVDAEPEQLHLDLDVARTQLAGNAREHSRIKAIIPVHLYGAPCEIEPLLSMAEKYECAVIEDGAHALPTRYHGKLVGSMAANSPVPLLTCFSFYATKNLTTAEGGMLTGSQELIDDARPWALHGMSRDAWRRYGRDGSWQYDVVCAGFKCNMTDIQAALGLHQLDKLPAFHRRRKEIADRYNTAFAEFEELQAPIERAGCQHAWHIYALRLNLEKLNLSRDQFVTEMRKRNIGTSVHFIPVHLFSFYSKKYGYRPEDFPVAFSQYQRVLSLPCGPRMSDEDVQDVIEAVVSVVKENARRTSAAVMVAN